MNTKPKRSMKGSILRQFEMQRESALKESEVADSLYRNSAEGTYQRGVAEGIRQASLIVERNMK